MNENEKNFENFMTEQNKKKKQTLIWRIFSTVCLVAIIALIIFRSLNCSCDCNKTTDTTDTSASYRVSSQITDGTTPKN